MAFAPVHLSVCVRGVTSWNGRCLNLKLFIFYRLYQWPCHSSLVALILQKEVQKSCKGCIIPIKTRLRDMLSFIFPPTKSLLKEILSFILSTKVLVRQDWSDIRLLSRIAISHPAGPISARSPSLRPTWRHRQFELFTFTNVTIMRQVMRSLKSAAWSLASLSGLCWLLTVNGLKQDLFILFFWLLQV